MAGQKFDLTFDAKLQVSQIKSALADVQNSLNGLRLPQNLEKGFTNTINKIASEIQNFEVSLNKGIGSKNDFSKLERNADKIVSLFEKLKLEVKDISGLSGSQLEKLFPDSITNSIKKATSALTDYSASLAKAEKASNSAESKVERLSQQLEKVQNTQPLTADKFKALKDSAKEAQDSVVDLQEKISKLTAEQTEMEARLTVPKKSSTYRENVEQLKQLNKQLEEAKIKSAELTQQSVTAITYETQAKQVARLTQELENAKSVSTQLKTELDALKSSDPGGGLDKLFEDISKATGMDLSSFEKTFENAGKAIDTYFNKAIQQASTGLNSLNNSVNRVQPSLDTLREGIRQSGQSLAEYDARARDISSLKMRIQYFFGLNNAIQLVRRTIRSAYQTITDLDKVMTETAVVTDFTVGDMWSQLPEYTKRANELGVATIDAYKAATLYYQQGLKTNEVTALSNETLKMARIAGLDAAEATDRMTNALRGFNMALTETNAQKVDDVYSQLAAITASNVDEISTAMTKVASLAHNANMEFETTAAFLAQIIETTRESAETAGTALKTVVARFSEVKKLFTKEQLTGTDEEGQLIDVNKVSQALRTAGIDLNKYFLGEVGLDDIFIELASKWENLTSVQQRYIATQAAGSRQQSRFIALMSDYARTQELTTAAYNSAGASARQFEKTQDSLQSKLARLKNAWNEFTMSITNSSLVKGAVDLLTNILNIVNKLTSGFGTLTEGVGGFANALAKIALIAATLGGGRILTSGLTAVLGSFVGKGVSPKLAMATAIAGEGGAASMANMSYGQLLWQGVKSPFAGISKARRSFLNNSSMYYGDLSGLVGDIDSPVSAVPGYTIPKTMFGALGNRFIKTGLGSKIQSGLASKLGGTALGSAFTGAAGGAATLAATLGIVGASLAAVAGTVAYLYHLSPQGQIAAAKKYAAVMEKVAKSAETAAKSNKDNFEQYKKYTKQVEESQTTAGLNKATQERNDYISSLLEQNKDYLQFVSSTFENGQLVLTLDEESFDKYVNEAQQKANQAVAISNFANSVLATKEANLAYSRSQNAYGIYSKQERVAYINEYSKQTALAQNYAQQAFNSLMPDNLSDELANNLSMALTKSFDADKFYKDVEQKRSDNWWASQATKSELKRTYKLLYGTEPDSDMKRKDLAKAVAQGQVEQKQVQLAENAANVINGNKTYQDIISAIAGNGKITETNFTNINEEDFITALGLDESQFKDLGKVLGYAEEDAADEVRKLVVATANMVKQIQQNNKAKVYQKIFESGKNIDAAVKDYIESLSPERTEQISLLYENGQGLLNTEQFANLTNLDALKSLSDIELKDLNELFSSIDLNSPINAFTTLQKAVESTNGKISEYAQQIIDANHTVFNAGNLVQSFITSEDYEELSDSLQKFIDENGEITSRNIEELADSSKDLKKLLDLDTVSAQGLAKALTALQKGTIPFDSITESVLAALSAGEDFNTFIDKIHKNIEDFNAGIDFGEGVDFIGKQAESLTELIENYEFGNQQTQRIYTQLFGEKGWAEIANLYGTTSLDQLSEYALSKVQEIQTLAENNSLEFMRKAATLDLGVTDVGEGFNFEWDLSRFNNTADLLSQVANKFQVSTESARMLIQGFAAQSLDFAQAWNELDYDTQIQAFANSLKDARVITEQELEAIAKDTGKTADQIYSSLQKQFTQKGLVAPVRVKWTDDNGQPLDGQALVNKVQEMYTQLEEAIPTISYKANSRAHTTTGIDANALYNQLSNYGLSEAQIISYIDAQAAEGQKLVKEVTLPLYEVTDEGAIHVTHTTVKVDADTWDGLTEAEDAAIEAAKYDYIGETIAKQDLSPLGLKLQQTLVSNAISAASQITTIVNGIKLEIPVSYKVENTPNIGINTDKNTNNSTSTNSRRPGAHATGGIVKSYAKGGMIPPGKALTGEEGPELIWNKENGYAYITGANGPQFQNLKPGDQIFNADQTKEILKNKGRQKVFGSYANATGGYNSDKINDAAGAVGEKLEEWKNELDRLYNLLQDIAEEQRKQTKLSEEYELLLKNPKSTSQDLIDNIALQLRSYNTEYAQQAKRFVERERDIEEYLKEKVDFRNYVWYNKDNEAEGINSVEIDWTRINNELKETDKDTYDKVVEIINHLEDIEKDRDEAEDAMLKLEAKIAELQDIWRDTFVDFQKRVLDAIVYEQQEIINRYSELSSTLSNTASSILQSLQDEISLQRQIRDNTKTEEDINEKEARLAYLRRDTTGKNAQEIMSLEKDISESRQNYSDSLVDQAIGRLSDTNDKAAEQREHQIEIMQAQLDYDKETGAFNERIESLIQSGIDAEGNLVQGRELEALLQNAEGWKGLTEKQREVWSEELNNTTKQVQAFLQKDIYQDTLGETLSKQFSDSENMVSQIKNAIDALDGDYDDVLGRIETALGDVAKAIGAIPQYQTAASYTSGDKSGGSGGGSGNLGGLAGYSKYKITDPNGATLKDGFLDTTSATDELNKQRQKMIDNYNALYKDVMSKPSASTDDYLDLAEMEKTMNRWKYAKIVPYKTGGLNTKTGPAWLDGTKSRPEYVLNADQTEAFLKLAEVLPQLLRSPTQTAGTKVAGDIYLDLVMNVDEIANDYDVDRIADRVKEIIYDASTYRNVNVINFIK